MPKTKIAITYNKKVGGSTVVSLKKSIKELGSEVVDADYRLIVPDLPDLQAIYPNKEKRSALFQQAKRSAYLYLKDIDGLILSGNNAMVDPRLYSVDLNKQKIDLARNIAEAALIHVAIQKGIPLLGICGGHQIINVYFGGSLKTLSPDSIDNQKFMDYSAIQIDAQSELGQILSHSTSIPQSEHLLTENFFGGHIQTIKGLGSKGLINDGDDNYLKCSAVAKNDNGNVEAIESKYGSPLMGLQFHPEIGVQGLPKQTYTFQAPNESEILKNRKIFEAFNQAAETYNHKKKMVSHIPLLRASSTSNLESSINKLNTIPAPNKKIKKSLKKQKNIFFRIMIYICKKIGSIIRKKNSESSIYLIKLSELKKFSSSPWKMAKKHRVNLQQEFLNAATVQIQKIESKNKTEKNTKIKPLNSVCLEKKQSHKKSHHHRCKKSLFDSPIFFKKPRKNRIAISKPKLHKVMQEAEQMEPFFQYFLTGTVNQPK